VDSQRRRRALFLFHAPSTAPRSPADTVAVASAHVLLVGNALGTAGTLSDGYQGHENHERVRKRHLG